MSGQEARDPAAPEVPETPVAPITCPDTSETAAPSGTVAEKSDTAVPITFTDKSETLEQSIHSTDKSETVVRSETYNKVHPITCTDKSETLEHSKTNTDKSETVRSETYNKVHPVTYKSESVEISKPNTDKSETVVRSETYNKVHPITFTDKSETVELSKTNTDKLETVVRSETCTKVHPVTCTDTSETALSVKCIDKLETVVRSETCTDTSQTKVQTIDKSETVHSKTCTDTSETTVQSADEVVENFFEGLDEDSFIAELQVVSAWGNNKNSDTFDKESENKITQVIDGLQKTTGVPTSDVMSDAIKAKPKPSPIPTLIRKPAKKIGKGKVSNYEKESALDRFKSFLPDGDQTEVFKPQNKRYQNAPNHVADKIEKPDSKVDLGVRRDPDKTKRDIERDKQNKNKETLIKKMETGLIPPGMEMEIDNSSVVKRQSVKRKESASPKPIKPQDNYRRRQDDYAPRPRYFKRSSNRTPTISPDRTSRYDRRSSRSSRSSRPGYERASCERRGSDRSNAGRSPPYERRREKRNRSRKRSRKSRASIEMELLATIPVQYPVRAPAPSVTYPPPVPVPAPSYNAPYLAAPYAVDGNSFSLETQQPMAVADTTANPNLSTTQDYYAPGYTQSYGTIPFNPDVMPPNAYSNGYSHVNNYTIPPPTDPTYLNVGCSNYVQPSSSYIAAPTTDGYSAYGNSIERDEVIRDCEKVVTELNTPHLPTHVYPSINNAPQTETLNEKINYSSPLNRNSTVNYSFTSSKNRNQVSLLPIIISTLEEKVGLEINNGSPTEKSTREVAVQTMSFSCGQCQLKGAFRQENKSVNTMHRIFMNSVHSQVTEEDLASSKIVFTPNSKVAATEDPKPVSLTHMTSAQILADLTAKTKNMQRSLVDTYRQSGGKIEDFAAKQANNHRGNPYLKSNLLAHMSMPNKNKNSSWKK